ncbi:MAG: hypothetical protein PHE21_00015 [Candidatus Dojkabacteria bacterium]|nr:hypothetical protein [Candidatus Dojkabacteria bacterium]
MLGIKPVLEVARQGRDLDDITLQDKDKSFSSERNTPKIYKSVVITRPSGVDEDTDYTTTLAHGLGYIPRFWHMIKVYDKWSHVGDAQPNYGSNTFSYVTVDNTNFNINLRAYTEKLQIFYMFDPLIDGTGNSIVYPNYPSIRVAKEGKDCDLDLPKDMHIDTLWNTPRVIKSGQLSITAPEDLMSYGSYHEVSYVHNLGYIPFFFPQIPTLTNLSTIYDGFANIPSVVDLNSLTDPTIASDDDMQSYELIYVQIDETELKISWWRENVWWEDDFPERTLTLDYTLYELALDEEFNLLT